VKCGTRVSAIHVFDALSDEVGLPVIHVSVETDLSLLIFFLSSAEHSKQADRASKVMCTMDTVSATFSDASATSTEFVS